MKSIVLLILAAVFTVLVKAQLKPAAAGFDTVRSSIAHRKIDTISYTLKTVGSNRIYLIVTPTGFSNPKKYP